MEFLHSTSTHVDAPHNAHEESRANVNLAFTTRLQEAMDNMEVGFHFEDGGCWGMALALREKIGGELLLRKDFVHVYVCVDGQLYDWRGQAVDPGVPLQPMTPDALVHEASKNNVNEDTLQNDLAWAKDVIGAAKSLAAPQHKHRPLRP